MFLNRYKYDLLHRPACGLMSSMETSSMTEVSQCLSVVDIYGNSNYDTYVFVTVEERYDDDLFVSAQGPTDCGGWFSPSLVDQRLCQDL